MAYTEPELIDRLLEQRAARNATTGRREIRTCDSCGAPLGAEVERTRFRHVGCPVPPLPPAARAVLDRLRSAGAAT